MISQKTRYAFRALFYLARANKPVSIATIAAHEKISNKFLEQVMADLKRHKLVISIRGQGGGYELARPAKDISYAEVIRIIDGPLAMAPCASVTAYGQCRDCYDAKHCPIQKALAEVREAAAKTLEKRKITDFLDILPS
jgi:Rrf2 family protein